MSYIKTQILQIENPIGLDLAISKIQSDLANQISYLNYIFGRAFIHKSSKGKSNYTIPRAYIGKNEYRDLMPNDNLKTYCFFISDGPASPVDYLNNKSNIYTRDVSLIFWGSLKSINANKDYIFTEEIKSDLLRVLTYNSAVAEIIEADDDEFEKIFKEFKTTDKYYESNTQFLMFPWHGIRIKMSITYSDGIDCNGGISRTYDENTLLDQDRLAIQDENSINLIE